MAVDACAAFPTHSHFQHGSLVSGLKLETMTYYLPPFAGLNGKVSDNTSQKISGQTFTIKLGEKQFAYHDFWSEPCQTVMAWLGLGRDHSLG